MRANQISDYESVQLVGQEKIKKSSYKSSNNRKIVATVLAVVLLLSAASCYFLISANRLKNVSYYMLILDSAQTTLEAGEKSSDIAKAGGSGYIINDGEFKICGALYSSLSDAENVLDRLKNDYPNAQIITYAFNAKRVSSDLFDALNYPIKLIDFMLTKSLELDLSQTTEGSALLSMASERINLDNHIKSIEGLTDDAAAKKTHEYLSKINDEWDYIGSLDTDYGVYNHRIKYFSCFLIDGYWALRNSI